MIKKYSILVIGGGAAGFFAAISAKNAHPDASVAIIEKNAALLSKVRVSGGGRCNVMHACFEPSLLVKSYPRGYKELLGPFHQFGPKDTLKWFESKGVSLKTEEDGRMFPTTDNSQTIIDSLINEARDLGVEVLIKKKIEHIEKFPEGFSVQLKEYTLTTTNLIMATGSSAQGHAWAKELGHTIISPVPSLFTFNVPHSPLKELSGVSFKEAIVKIKGTSFEQRGPLLITHFGFSGPAALKLSAWAARELHKKEYIFEIFINWIPDLSLEELRSELQRVKEKAPKKTLLSENPFKLPKNFWKLFLQQAGKLDQKRLSDLSLKEIQGLCEKLHKDTFQVKGKTTNKEEFVTCGGINLKEINFKKMESKICPGLFFAGEVLNIDGITGGFNFQNAWTTGHIAGKNCQK